MIAIQYSSGIQKAGDLDQHTWEVRKIRALPYLFEKTDISVALA